MGGLHGRIERKSLNWTLEEVGWSQVESERCLGSEKGCEQRLKTEISLIWEGDQSITSLAVEVWWDVKLPWEEI